MGQEIQGEPLCRKRGDTSPDLITVRDEASTATPKTPIDNTGFSYSLTINTEKDPEVGIGTQLVQIAGQVGGANGEVQFAFTPIQADQVADVYWYDIEQVDAAGFVKTIAKNTYTFFQDITKVN